jgi:hypothetical protein
VREVAGRRFTGEQEYIQWLGLRARVFKEEASNMIAVCEGMLAKIVKNLLR